MKASKGSCRSSLHHRRRHTEHACHLVDAHVEEVPERQHHAISGLQTLHRAPYIGTFVECFGPFLVKVRPASRDQQPSPAGDIAAFVDDNHQEPRSRTAFVAKLVKLPPRVQSSVLQRVLTACAIGTMDCARAEASRR